MSLESDATYNVTLSGQLLENIERADAVAAFATLFKLTLEKAEAHLARTPVVIKKAVDHATAQKFSAALQSSGLQCLVEPVADQQAAAGVEADVVESQVSEVNTGSDIVEQATEVETVTSEAATAETPAPETLTPDSQPGFQFEMTGEPDYSFVTVQIPAEQTLKVEASAMATMDTNVRMKTKMRGGLGRLLTGENIFINEFTAEGVAGEIGIAPGTPGDLRHRYLDGDTIYLQNSAFVACGPEVEVETKWQGLTKGFFSGESLFLIRAQGRGDLWFNSYGAIIEIDVSGDYVVDTGNIVAFTGGLDYDITKVGGYKSFFFSGEGFVCRFSGEGKVWIQTRSAAAFVNWAHWFRPVEKKKD